MLMMMIVEPAGVGKVSEAAADVGETGRRGSRGGVRKGTTTSCLWPRAEL